MPVSISLEITGNVENALPSVISEAFSVIGTKSKTGTDSIRKHEKFGVYKFRTPNIPIPSGKTQKATEKGTLFKFLTLFLDFIQN